MREPNNKISFSELIQRIVDPTCEVDFYSRFCGGATLGRTIHMTQWRRRTDHHLVLVVQSGTVQVNHEQYGENRIEGGMGFYFSPHARPDIEFTEGVVYHECYFKPLPEQDCATPIIIANQVDDLVSPLHAIGESLRQPSVKSNWLARLWLAPVLETFTQRSREQETRSQNHRTLNSSQRRAIADWTSAHIYENPLPSDLAAHLQISPEYFTRLFRATYGQTPRSWLAEQRIREAIRLLEHSQMNINEIASTLGYADSVHFCRKFKELTGTSPLKSKTRQ